MSKEMDNLIAHLLTGERGGFATSLASAWQVADSENRARLEQAFPNLLVPRVQTKFRVSIVFEGPTDHEIHEYNESNVRNTIKEALFLPDWQGDGVYIGVKVDSE